MPRDLEGWRRYDFIIVGGKTDDKKEPKPGRKRAQSKNTRAAAKRQHQLRNSSKYVSYKDIKALMADLRSVYSTQPIRLKGLIGSCGK